MAFEARDVLVPANGREVELVLVVVGHGPERAPRRRRADAATILAIIDRVSLDVLVPPPSLPPSLSSPYHDDMVYTHT